MRFFVIYSFDCTKDDSVKRYQPPNVRKWDWTEGDDQYDYNYLEGDWINGKHRKYCREMSKAEFNEFVDDCGLYMEDVDTMGSLTGWGLLPAFSFNADFYSCIANAYVTPIPEVEHKKELTEERSNRYWELTKQAMLNMYS